MLLFKAFHRFKNEHKRVSRMNVEKNRLNTFTDWPANAAVDAARIAKAGFYYTGRALEVQCFLCGVKISNWNYGDQVIVRHRLAEPSCPFVQNPSATCNVPLIPVSTNNSGFGSPSTELPQNNATENESSNSNHNDEVFPKGHSTVSERLQTFTNWPIPSVISPEDLAKAGFYYLQHGDEVKCAYCDGILQKWEPNDNPVVEHRKHFPDCDFYMHLKDDTDRTLKIETAKLENFKLTLRPRSDQSELRIHRHTTPRESDHATYEGRLRTFNGWPENLIQTPEMLASAGFYYDGSGDTVTCFHCDGSLRNWEATDNVWTEHARWFPRCQFVTLVRGQEFIQKCIEGRPPLDESIFEGVPENENMDTAEMPPTSLPEDLSATVPVADTELDRFLQSPPVTAALQIGLHKDKIKLVLKKRIEEVGIPYTNAKQLVEDVLSYQVTGALSSASGDQCIDIEKNKFETCATENGNSKVSATVKNTFEKKKHIKISETASLEEENRRLREARLCKICMDREVSIVLLPCGHLATCVYCALPLEHCPMCRLQIRAIVRTFLS